MWRQQRRKVRAKGAQLVIAEMRQQLGSVGSHTPLSMAEFPPLVLHTLRLQSSHFTPDQYDWAFPFPTSIHVTDTPT